MTPTERAARAHYVHQAVTRDGLTEKQAIANWEYSPETDNWRALRVQAIAVAIRVYREAVAQESAAKRDRAVKTAMEVIADGCGCDRHCCATVVGADVYCGCENDACNAISAYERVMAEPDAAQPRKEGA